MRARAVVCGAAALLSGASAAACFDLFHSTSFETACELDAASCEDASAVPPPEDAAIADAGTDGPTDFCAWDGATARANAARACAWLGACAGAIADDAFGPCLLRATLAYDCAANPNRPVRGAAHAFWDCVAGVASCGEVETCVEPSGTRGQCSATTNGYASCEGTSANPGTFIACDAGVGTGTPPAALESCAAQGQSCVTLGTAAACSGSPIACTAAGVSCDDAGGLHDCDPDGGPVDFGVSCASFGAGACASVGACVAVGAPACTPTTAISCNGAIATGCPSGVAEQVDCQAILGAATGACDPNAPGRPWDVSRGCYAGPTGADSCPGQTATLSSSIRGAPVTLDCGSVGLGPCVLTTYPGDSVAHAHCTPP